MVQPPGPGWPELRSGGAWPDPQPEVERTPWYARRRLWLAVAVCSAVGYVVAGTIATARVYWDYHRKPTKGELYRAATEEVAQRWRVWPATRIFPDSVPYTSEQEGVEQAKRIGIAPGSDCAAGIDPVQAVTLRQYGCRALMRATYVDALQGVVFTVGVVAVDDEDTAGKLKIALEPGDPTVPGRGLHALPFPGTIAAKFTDAARQYTSTGQAGPYVVLAVAGQTDGRPGAAVQKKHTDALLLAPEAAGNIAGALARRAQPDCAQKRQWKC